MAKKLEGLKWQPSWISHMGCLKGCLEHIGSDMSWGWLYGATGHAFVLNVHEGLCPSGPTAWNGGTMLCELAPNAGILSDQSLAFKNSDDFRDGQRRAFEFVRDAIDAGTPCYGWELAIPEYYVIHGYDGEEYLFNGCLTEGEARKPLAELGDTGIGVLSVHKVELGEPADDAKTVGDACRYAVKFGSPETEWLFNDAYRSGPAGYERWAEALESGAASADGHGYNAKCWGECRRHAVGFLTEARERLGANSPSAGGALDEAVRHYEAVAAKFDEADKLRPWDGPQDGYESKFTSAELAALMRGAGEAEAKGLAALAEVAEAFAT